MKYTNIRSIAKAARIDLEKIVLEEYNDLDMTGWCGVAAIHLWKEFKKKRAKPKLILAEGGFFEHCWIEIGDYAIDITATQFDWGRRRKVVCENIITYNKRIPNDVFIFHNEKAYNEIEKFWPKDQKYTTYKNRLE